MWLDLGKGVCIVHTSNFSTLVSYKIYLEWQIHVQLSGILDPLFLYQSWKFQFSIPFHVVFMGLQVSKLGCVNYARLPKSSHKLLCQVPKWYLFKFFAHILYWILITKVQICAIIIWAICVTFDNDCIRLSCS